MNRNFIFDCNESKSKSIMPEKNTDSSYIYVLARSQKMGIKVALTFEYRIVNINKKNM